MTRTPTNPLLSQPVVTALMPAFNSAAVICNAIESVIAQTFQSWELIIVNDASTDDTRHLAERYAAQDPRIRVISLTRNGGAGTARNEALKVARGNYIAITDSDDISYPNRFSTQVAFLESHPDMSVVASQLDEISANGTAPHWLRYPGTPEGIAADFLRGQMGAPNPSSMIRSLTFQQAGPYVEECKHGQDLEFFIRITPHHLFTVLDEPLVAYRIAPQPLGWAQFCVHEKERLYAIYRATECPAESTPLSLQQFNASPRASARTSKQFLRYAFVRARTLPGFRRVSATRLGAAFITSLRNLSSSVRRPGNTANSHNSLGVILPSGANANREYRSYEDYLTNITYFGPFMKSLESTGVQLEHFTGARIASSSEQSIRTTHFQGRLVSLPAGKSYDRRLLLVGPSLMLSVFRSRSATILCCEYSLATILALAGAKLSRKQFWLFQEARRPLSGSRKVIRRAIAAQADLLVAGSAGAVMAFHEDLNQPSAKVIQAPLVSSPPRDFFEERHSVTLNALPRPRFLVVARLVDSKNVRVVLHASGQLARSGYDFNVTIIGSGPLMSSLRAECEELDIGRHVHFLGQVPYKDMGTYYAAAEVLIHPSKWDYRSVAVLEAMRFGLSIICTTNDGNANDNVVPMINGFLFAPDDPIALANHMETFIHNRGLIATFGTASTTIASSQTPAIAAGTLVSTLRGGGI